MEWEPEQQNLGGLGFAGICREIYRVSLLVFLPNTRGSLYAAILSALLFAPPATFHVVVVSGLDVVGSSHFIRYMAVLIAGCLFLFLVCFCVLLPLSLGCTAIYVFRVAALYCTDGDAGATDRLLRDLPPAPVERLVFTLAIPYILSTLAWLELPQLDASRLHVLGGAVCLVGAAYFAVVSHIACVVAMLEDAVHFGALRKSRALLAGKLWQAAAVFLPLDGCFVALQIFFTELVLDDALGLGLWFQVAAGAAMAVALWVVVVVTLVAQPVVYLVCKNHHHEVVDKIHLHYVGEYERLAVDGDSAVELQPVNTAPQVTPSAAQVGCST